MDGIQQRIKDALASKNQESEQAISLLEQQLQKERDTLKALQEDYIKDETKAETKKTVGLQDAEAEYQTAKNVVNNQYQEAQEQLAALQSQIDAQQSQVSSLEDHTNTQTSSIESNLAAFKESMQAELDLVDRIRGILDKLYHREYKALGEHCDSNFNCLEGLECRNNVCTAQAGGKCSENSHCISGMCSNNGVCQTYSFLMSDQYGGEAGSYTHCWRGHMFEVEETIAVDGLYAGSTGDDRYGAAIFKMNGNTVASLIVSTDVNQVGRGVLYPVSQVTLYPNTRYMLAAGSIRSGSASVYRVNNVDVEKLVTETPISYFNPGHGTFGCTRSASDVVGSSGGSTSAWPDLGIHFVQ